MFGNLSRVDSPEKIRPPISANKPAIQNAVTHQLVKNMVTTAPTTISVSACQDSVLVWRITGCHNKKQPKWHRNKALCRLPASPQINMACSDKIIKAINRSESLNNWRRNLNSGRIESWLNKLMNKTI